MLNDGLQAAIFFWEEPSGQPTQVLLKGRQPGTPAWTAQHPPYAHGAHTGTLGTGAHAHPFTCFNAHVHMRTYA